MKCNVRNSVWRSYEKRLFHHWHSTCACNGSVKGVIKTSAQKVVSDEKDHLLFLVTFFSVKEKCLLDNNYYILLSS